MILHKSPISGIATFGNKYLATAGYDNTVILWDSNKKQSIARGCHDHLVNQCTFSKDGKLLATSSSDFSVRLWSVPSMKLVTLLIGHVDDVEGLSFNMDKQLIATCSRDKTIKLFKFTGELVNTLEGHTEDVISVEWMHGTDLLISSSDDGTVKFWNSETGKIVKDLSFNNVETDTIALTSDGVIFAGNDEGEIVLIKMDEDPIMIPCHEAGIKRLVFSETMNKLISLSYDRSFKVWNYIDGSLVLKSTHIFENIVWPRSAAFLNEKEIVFASFGDRYAHFDLENTKWLNNNINPTNGINSVCEFKNDKYTIGDAGYVRKNGKVITKLGSLCNFITPFGETLVSGGQTGEIFNALTGKVITQHKSPLNCGKQFLSNGKRKMAVGSYTGEVIILTEDENGNPVYECDVKFQENAIKGLDVSDKYIFSVCATGNAAFHNKETFDKVNFVKDGHNQIANDCVYLKDDTFASISRDLCLRLWSIENVELFKTQHKNSIKCVSSDEKGDFLMLGDYTGHISIFDTEKKMFVNYLRLSDFGISNISYDKENDVFLASSYNGRVYVVKTPVDNYETTNETAETLKFI